MQIATIVTPNKPELEILTGRDEIADEDMFDAAKVLAERHGVRVLASGHAGDETQVVDHRHRRASSILHVADRDTAHAWHRLRCLQRWRLLGYRQPLTLQSGWRAVSRTRPSCTPRN